MDVDGDHHAEHLIVTTCNFGGNAISDFVAAVRLDQAGTVIMVGDLLDPNTVDQGYSVAVNSVDVGDGVLTTHDSYCLHGPNGPPCLSDSISWRLDNGAWTHVSRIFDQDAIRGFDFGNQDYTLGDDFDGITAEAANGEFSFTDSWGYEWVGSVGSVEYGDLTADGVEEAAVSLFWSSPSATCRCETVVVLTLDGNALDRARHCGGR